MKISELNEDQKCHLAWRLDHKTACGLLTACRIARGELGDMDLVEVFKWTGKTDRSAKIHARKVIDFKLIETEQLKTAYNTEKLKTLYETAI